MIILIVLGVILLILATCVFLVKTMNKENEEKTIEIGPKVPPLTRGPNYPVFFVDDCLFYFPASKSIVYEDDTKESLMEKRFEAEKKGKYDTVIEICDQIIVLDYKFSKIWLDKINAIFNSAVNGQTWSTNTSKVIVNCCYNYIKTFSNSYEKTINAKHMLLSTLTKRFNELIDYNLENLSETYNFEIYNLLINLYYLMPFSEFLDIALINLTKAKDLKEVLDNQYAIESIRGLTTHVLMLKEKYKVPFEEIDVEELKITRKNIIVDERMLTTWIGFNIQFPSKMEEAELVFKFYDYRRQEIDLTNTLGKRYVEFIRKKEGTFYSVVILGENKIKYVTIELSDENKKFKDLNLIESNDEEVIEKVNLEIDEEIVELSYLENLTNKNNKVEENNVKQDDLKQNDLKKSNDVKPKEDKLEIKEEIEEFEYTVDNCVYKLYPNYSNIKQISLCENYVMLLKENGNVEIIGFPDKSIDISLWENIDTVYATNFAVYAIRKDGTIAVTGKTEYNNWEYQYIWKDIQKLELGYNHLIGLKTDGTVVAVGENTFGQCEVSEWINIVDVSASFHTVGLDKDGKVYALGENVFGECDISNWDNIDKIATGPFFTVGLRNNGTVVAAGLNSCGQCNTENWTDVKNIYVSGNVTVGLRYDGKVYVAGRNSYRFEDAKKWNNVKKIIISNSRIIGILADGRINYIGKPYWGRVKEDWKNVVDVEANSNYLVAKKIDGRLVCNKTLFDIYMPNDYKNFEDIKQSTEADKIVVLGKDGKIDIFPINNIDLYKWDTDKFYNIKQISMSKTHLVGLKNNGTAVVTGNDASLEFTVESWENLVKVEAGENFIVGLTKDGRVLATGNNSYGQCDVNDWVDIVDIAVYGIKTVGLKSDGSVCIKGWIEYDEEEFINNANYIAGIAVNSKQIMLLDTSGRVSLSYNPIGHDKQKIIDWGSIEKIIATENDFIALKNDQTVLTTGDQEIDGWRNITDIKAAGKMIIGVIRKG